MQLPADNASAEPLFDGKPITHWLAIGSGLGYAFTNDSHEMERATEILDSIRWSDPVAVAALFRALEDEQTLVATMAARRIVRFGTEAVPSLVEVLRNGNVASREIALDILAGLQPLATEVINLAILELSAGGELGDKAARFLAHTYDDHGEHIVQALAPLLEGYDNDARAAAYWVLMCVQDLSDKPRPTLTTMRLAVAHPGNINRATWTLVKMGPEAVPLLVETMESGEVEAVCAATQHLRGRISLDPALHAALVAGAPRLFKLLHSPQRQVRESIMILLYDTVPDAPELGMSEYEPVVAGAPASLWLALAGGMAIGEKAREQTESVLQAITWEDRDVMLGIFHAMRSETSPIAHAGAQQLLRFVPHVIPLLIEGVADASREMRHQAMWALASIRPTPQQAIPVAVSSLPDPYDQVACQAVHFLERAAPAHGGAFVDDLKVLLAGDDDDLLNWALDVLAAFRADAHTALHAVGEALSKTNSASNAYKAVAVLLNIGPDAMPVLVAGLTARNVVAARAAADGLRRLALGPQRAVVLPYLNDIRIALGHADLGVATDVVYVVDALAPECKGLVAAAIRSLGHDALAANRSAMCSTLARHPDQAPVIVPALTTALSDLDWDVRATAAKALVRLGPAARSALPRLRELLTEEMENGYPDLHGETERDRLRLAVHSTIAALTEGGDVQ